MRLHLDDLLNQYPGLLIHLVGPHRGIAVDFGPLTFSNGRFPAIEWYLRGCRDHEFRRSPTQLENPRRQTREMVLLVSVEVVKSLSEIGQPSSLGPRGDIPVRERLFLFRPPQLLQSLDETGPTQRLPPTARSARSPISPRPPHRLAKPGSPSGSNSAWAWNA